MRRRGDSKLGVEADGGDKEWGGGRRRRDPKLGFEVDGGDKEWGGGRRRGDPKLGFEEDGGDKEAQKIGFDRGGIKTQVFMVFSPC